MSEGGRQSASKKSTVEENRACLWGALHASTDPAASAGSSQLVPVPVLPVVPPPSSSSSSRLGVLARLGPVSSVTCPESEVLLGEVAQLEPQEQLLEPPVLGEGVRLPEAARLRRGPRTLL